MKEKRKKIQEKNKEKKELVKEELKMKSIEGMKKVQDVDKKPEDNVHEDVDDDTEYYRQEVGEEPEKGN